jgi:MFS family permease
MSSWLLYFTVVGFMTTYRASATAAFSTLAMVVNASVDRELRGTLNGLIMTCGSLGNAGGPILGAALYASAVALPRSSGIDGRIAFLMAAILIFILAVAAKCSLKAR